MEKSKIILSTFPICYLGSDKRMSAVREGVTEVAEEGMKVQKENEVRFLLASSWNLLN